MRKKLLLAVAFVFFIAATAMYSPREASAIPAFARQTGFACSTCHYQHFPELNAFGRSFKAGGFTMVGGVSLIEGQVLSLPSVLNASLITKAQFRDTYGSNTAGKASEYDNGAWDFPIDDSLFIAGRGGDHFGFLSEISVLNPAAAVASFKIPITFNAYDTTLDIIPFSGGAGPSWAFEVLNTGIVETHTALLHKPETFAANYIGASQDATGVAFVAYKPIGYLDYTLWSNDFVGFSSGTHEHIASPLHYIRLAVTPTVAGWDLGGGFAGWFGTESHGPLDGPTKDAANAWAIDFQAQGNVYDRPLGIYTSFADAGASSASDVANLKSNIFNPGDKDMTAWTILAEYGLIPNTLAASVGYRLAHNGDPNRNGQNTTDDATTLALIYTPALNWQFGIEHSWYSGRGPRSEESADGYCTNGGAAGGCGAAAAGATPAGLAAGPEQLTTVTMWIAF